MDWFSRENLQETIDFPIKYGAFLYINCSIDMGNNDVIDEFWWTDT